MGPCMSSPAAPYVGKPTIHMVWKVPAADETEIDQFWVDHETWMKSAHSFGTGEEPCLLKYYIAKGKELNNPMDPTSGETGMLLYVMAETYDSSAGIGKHLEKAGEGWAGMAKLGEYAGKYGVLMEVGSCAVFTCLSDAAETSLTEKGQPTITIAWRVPAADEATVDAYWKSHEEWMRKSHTMGLLGDDKLTPRLTSFSINKGKEMNNPMDPASGETGNLLYIMSETYAAPGGIAAHFAKGPVEWPGMAQVGDFHGKYGMMMECGQCAVMCNLGAKMK